MIDNIEKWVALGLVALGGIAAWFNNKSDARMLEARVETLEKVKPEKVDLSAVAENTLRIQRLELANERAEEQRINLLRMVEKTQEGVEKQADKQDKFQQEVLQGITRLSTELQERTKALHS